MEISKDGSFIAVCMNGEFQKIKKDNDSFINVAYGHPSLFVIAIPEVERPFD